MATSAANAVSSAARALSAIAAALVLSAAVHDSAGAADEPYLVEYRAFRAALEAGDSALAAEHGLRAWQAAEETLGDDRLTAILAYNYGHLILFSDPKGADEAMSRAVELQEAGVGDLDPATLRLYAAFAEFKADRYRRHKANRLREALEAGATGNNDEQRADQIDMWLALASGDLADERFDAARGSAARAESLVRRAVPGDSRRLAQAILLGGVARLRPLPRTVDGIQQAHNAFVRAHRLFPPQPGIADFDPLLGEIVAWDGAAKAALRTLGEDDYPDHEDLDSGSPHSLPDLFEEGSSELCDTPEWVERGPPRYPSGALRRHYIGAVIVGFHVGEDLTVTDARVLAEVPRETFADAVLESMEDWRLAAPLGGDPGCRRNLTTKFTFVIDQ